jgi:predicted nucleotidyltransferase
MAFKSVNFKIYYRGYKERSLTMKSEINIPKMNPTIKNKLDFIIDTVTANTTPESIYLFGSYANGVPNGNSDIDIYVVVPDSEADTIELCAKIHLDLSRKKTLPIDLLIGKKSIFENRKNRLTLEHIIANEGVKIYG